MANPITNLGWTWSPVVLKSSCWKGCFPELLSFCWFSPSSTTWLHVFLKTSNLSGATWRHWSRPKTAITTMKTLATLLNLYLKTLNHFSWFQEMLINCDLWNNMPKMDICRPHGQSTHRQCNDCLKVVPKLFRSCPKVVSKLSQSCIKVVSKLSQRCSKVVSKLYQSLPEKPKWCLDSMLWLRTSVIWRTGAAG